jgi:predicted DCC family thiol-disulfide oxidoreductase YuxK
MDPSSHPVVLFDGLCNLCEGSVLFIIKRDPSKIFRFASLQSKFGQDLLQRFQLPKDDFDTMVLVEGERVFKRSTAALKVAKSLRFPWPLFYVFILVPPFIRNFFYRIVARNRYRWFGKKEACLIPTPELRSRFLD